MARKGCHERLFTCANAHPGNVTAATSARPSFTAARMTALHPSISLRSPSILRAAISPSRLGRGLEGGLRLRGEGLRSGATIHLRITRRIRETLASFAVNRSSHAGPRVPFFDFGPGGAIQKVSKPTAMSGAGEGMAE